MTIIIQSCAVSSEAGVQESETGLSFLDAPLRFSLAALGIYSGPSSNITNRFLKVWTTGLHLLLSIVGPPCHVTIAAFTIWDLANNFNNTTNYILYVYDFSLLIFNMWVTLITVLMFYECHRRQGLRAYYKVLRDVEDHLQEAGIKVHCRPIRRGVWALTVLLWVCVSVSLVVMVFTVYHTSADIISSGRELTVLSSLSPASILFLQILLKLIWTTYYLQLPGFTFYFLTVCVVQYTAFKHINLALSEATSDSSKLEVEKIKMYRKVHLNTCGIIAEASVVFKRILGVFFLCGTCCLLLAVYLLSKTWRPFFLFWIIVPLTMMLAVAASAHLAVNECVAAQDSLYDLDDERLTAEEKTSLQLQVQLFRMKLANPEEYTSAGLFVINKDFGVKLIGILLSYLIIVVQFNITEHLDQLDIIGNITSQNVTDHLMDLDSL